jgi:AmmeMemoRadiSam system protein A
MSNEHPLVKLAKATIEAYVREQRTLDPPEELTPEMQGRAGAFVSLYDSLGNLRGCIGTIEPREPNLAQEVIHNAISAATSDPRFPPVRADELDDLTIKVDVLTDPEPIDGPQELDPRRYGVIVQSASDYRRGLLLPDLEGVDTVEYQVEIARRKAGIGPKEPVKLYRFEVKRYT